MMKEQRGTHLASAGLSTQIATNGRMKPHSPVSTANSTYRQPVMKMDGNRRENPSPVSALAPHRREREREQDSRERKWEREWHNPEVEMGAGYTSVWK